jgi:hypothetical protein
MGSDREDGWFIVTREVNTIDKETEKEIIKAGAQIGGGWSEIHQHIYIDAINQNEAISILREKGYTVKPLAETKMCHPEGACQINPPLK